jgi:hypothetical protein
VPPLALAESEHGEHCSREVAEDDGEPDVGGMDELRRDGLGIAEANREAAILRLRPIMMTALVAAVGLLPAALSTGVGSDTQNRSLWSSSEGCFRVF